MTRLAFDPDLDPDTDCQPDSDRCLWTKPHPDLNCLIFMMQVLFPYAARRLRAHLEETYDSAETVADIDLLRQLVSAALVQRLKPERAPTPTSTLLRQLFECGMMAATGSRECCSHFRSRNTSSLTQPQL